MQHKNHANNNNALCFLIFFIVQLKSVREIHILRENFRKKCTNSIKICIYLHR